MKTARRHRQLLSLLAELFVRFGNKLVGAEIGVYRASTSAFLLERFGSLQLSLVDSWAAHEPNSSYVKSGDEMANFTNEQQEENLAETKRRVKRFHRRATVIREDSVKAAISFGKRSLHFVFIDANHSREAVASEIAAWWPKIRPGGVLCGHDYGQTNLMGVTLAVHDFAAANRLTVDAGWGKVWWIWKPLK